MEVFKVKKELFKTECGSCGHIFTETTGNEKEKCPACNVKLTKQNANIIETFSIYDETMKHLNELDAFIVPNPIVAKAITLQRLMKAGVSEYEACTAINHAIREHGLIKF
jgi:DNA-directed RNA polymerase subunit RPC12/RpoP